MIAFPLVQFFIDLGGAKHTLSRQGSFSEALHVWGHFKLLDCFADKCITAKIGGPAGGSLGVRVLVDHLNLLFISQGHSLGGLSLRILRLSTIFIALLLKEIKEDFNYSLVLADRSQIDGESLTVR